MRVSQTSQPNLFVPRSPTGLRTWSSRSAHRLMASSEGMTSAQSAEFFVYAAADGVAQLIFQTEPSLTVEIGATLVPTPIVITADADGRRVYNSTLVVSLSIDPTGSLNQARLVPLSAAARVPLLPKFLKSQRPSISDHDIV